jgi:hypothetical protein
MPGALGSGDATTATLTAYDANGDVATGYFGTVHFISTDGAATLPIDYTFIGSDAGTHMFTNGFTLRTVGSHVITVTDVASATITGSKGVTVGPPTPTGLAATAAGATQVNVTWSTSAGAAQYEVLRASASPIYTLVTTTAIASFSDTTVTAANAYVHKVRAIDSSARPSPFSTPDAATTVVFTDDPVVGGVTPVKAVHLTQIRQAINALRTTAGLTAAAFTDPVLNSSIRVKAAHVQELRTALTAARTALGLSTINYTDPTLVAGTTKVRALHIQELRSGVK